MTALATGSEQIAVFKVDRKECNTITESDQQNAIRPSNEMTSSQEPSASSVHSIDRLKGQKHVHNQKQRPKHNSCLLFRPQKWGMGFIFKCVLVFVFHAKLLSYRQLLEL